MSNPTPITLSITVISATELAAADSNGLSDPYVSLTIQDSSGTTGGSHLSKKTNVMKKTLNPVWNENFVFSLTDKELEKYGYLGIKVKDYDRFSKNEEIGWANLEMRRFTKDKVETKWFSLNYQGRIQLTIEAKGFGANPYGVIFDDFVPSVTFRTFDQEAIYKVLDDVARSLEELTIVQNQIKLTIDTKKKRVESATAMANTLRNYPASASLLSAADRSHLPADQVDLVAHVESQLQTMIKSNDSSEDEIVLNTLNQRVISLQEVQARTQGIQKMRQQLESELSLLRTEMLNADQWAFK